MGFSPTSNCAGVAARHYDDRPVGRAYLQLRKGDSAWDSLPRRIRLTTFMTSWWQETRPWTIRAGARISKRYCSKTAGHKSAGECPVYSASVMKTAWAASAGGESSDRG